VEWCERETNVSFWLIWCHKGSIERKLRASPTARPISGVKFIYLVRLGQIVNTILSVFLPVFVWALDANL
jgi:hypothetical protein